MTFSRRLSHCLTFLLACGLLTGTSSLFAQPPGVLQETVSLEVSAVATRRLSIAHDLVVAADWNGLLDTLAEIQDRHRGELISLSPSHFVSVELAIQQLVCSLPPAGLNAYRNRVEPLWTKRLQQALVREDEVELYRIAEQGFATRAADRAIQELAQLAWERGDLDAAANLWRRLLPSVDSAMLPTTTSTVVSPMTPMVSDGLQAAPVPVVNATSPSAALPKFSISFPDSTLSPEQVAARLLLVDLLKGDHRLATRELQQFRERYPMQVGDIGGFEGPLHVGLKTAIESSRDWSPMARDWSWPMMGRNVFRNATAEGERVEIGPLLWSRPVSGRRTLKRLRVAEQVTAAAQPEHFIVSLDDHCFLQELDRVLAFQSRNGAIAWPTVAVAPPSEHPVGPTGVDSAAMASSDDDGTIFESSGPHALPELSLLGDEVFAPLVAGDDLICVMGMPIGLAGSREPRDLPMRVICLDVGRQEGKLRWTHPVEDWLPDGNWRISGPGLAVDERLYFPIRQGVPGMSVGLLAIDRVSGSMLWSRTICGVLSATPSHYHTITADLLSYGENALLLRAAARATFSVAPLTGGIQWVAIDDPAPLDPYARIPLAELPGLPCVVDRGMAYVVQSDRQTVQRLDLRTGQTIWKRKLPTSVTHVMGVASGILVLAGHQLWGVDTTSGVLWWRFGFDDIEATTAGQGLILGDEILWPTREELFVVNLSTGDAVRRIPLKEAYGLGGGHLSLAPHRLLLSSPTHLSAFPLTPALP